MIVEAEAVTTQDFPAWVKQAMRLKKLLPSPETEPEVRQWFAMEVEFLRILPEKAELIHKLSTEMANAFPDFS